MALAYLEHHSTLTEIGRAAGLHYATVRRIINARENTSQYKI
jgi:DNA-binding IclR family transcriptional regulator